MGETTRVITSASQDFLHRPPLRQLVDQLVQISDLPHQRILDLLDPDAADDAGDLADVRMKRRRFGEEGLEVRLAFDLLGERFRAVARQPADDLVDFSSLAPFPSAFRSSADTRWRRTS